jgi:hypothetical protein
MEAAFEAWLPAAVAGTAPQEVGPETLPLGRGETVLLCESERERLLREEEMLAALGYEPVGTGTQSMRSLRAVRPPDRFDIILVSHASHIPGRARIGARAA